MVFDGADRRLFSHIDMNAPAFGCLLALDTNVFEVAGVPQGIEVALQGGLIVNVAFLGEDSGFYGVYRNATVPLYDDSGNDVFLSPEWTSCQKKTQQEPEDAATRAHAFMVPNGPK